MAMSGYVTASEEGGPIKYTGPVSQQDVRVTLRVVLFVLSHTAAATGSGARQQMDSLVIPQVRMALFGWTPGDRFNALSFRAGRDEKFDAGWLVSQQIFISDYRLSHRSEP